MGVKVNTKFTLFWRIDDCRNSGGFRIIVDFTRSSTKSFSLKQRISVLHCLKARLLWLGTIDRQQAPYPFLQIIFCSCFSTAPPFPSRRRPARWSGEISRSALSDPPAPRSWSSASSQPRPGLADVLGMVSQGMTPEPQSLSTVLAWFWSASMPLWVTLSDRLSFG